MNQAVLPAKLTAGFLPVSCRFFVPVAILLTAIHPIGIKVHAGLYVLVAPVLAALAGGVMSAWVFLIRIKQ